MSCGKDAKKCKSAANDHGNPESTAVWSAGRGSAGHCPICGGFLTSDGQCHNDHTMTMSLSGGTLLGADDKNDGRGICPRCGSRLSVGYGEEDWCVECEEMVTAWSREVAEHLRALNDKSWVVRQDAVYELGWTRSPAVIPVLVNVLSDDDHFYVRQAAVDALRDIGTSAVVGALVSALRDEDSGVRWRAAEALRDIGDPSAIPALVSVLSDKDPKVRRRAAKALGKIRDPAAIPALTKALSDEAPYVRQEAQAAIDKIEASKLVAGKMKLKRSGGVRE